MILIASAHIKHVHQDKLLINYNTRSSRGEPRHAGLESSDNIQYDIQTTYTKHAYVPATYLANTKQHNKTAMFRRKGITTAPTLRNRRTLQ